MTDPTFPPEHRTEPTDGIEYICPECEHTVHISIGDPHYYPDDDNAESHDVMGCGECEVQMVSAESYTR